VRLAVPDLISPSYFPAVAAIDLGLARAEGLDVTLELLYPVTDAAAALRDGTIDFLAGAAHAPMHAFPGWRGAKLVAALSQNRCPCRTDPACPVGVPLGRRPGGQGERRLGDRLAC
jgi:sulfonate transport system substrate-binding protein